MGIREGGRRLEDNDGEAEGSLSFRQGSHPKQPKHRRRRKQHVVAPLNGLKSESSKYFSIDGSVVPLSSNNVEPSVQASEKLLRQVEVRRKKRTFPHTKGLKHGANATVSFDISGVPFPGDVIDPSLQFSKTVPSEGEVNHSNQKHSQKTGRRGKAMSRVFIREDDRAVSNRVARHYFTSLDQNLKTSFLSTSSPNKEPLSASFEAARSCEIPLPEKVSLERDDMLIQVDSALDIQKSTKKRCSRRSRKRGKGGRCEQHMAYSSLQLQSDFVSNHFSAARIPERWNDSENTNVVPAPLANKLVPSTEKGKCCLTDAAFDDSKNVCILSEVNLVAPNCSDIGTHGEEINMARKQEIKCLKNEVHENLNASFPESIIHKGKDVTGALALNNLSSLDNEMDCLHVAVERALRSPLRKKLLVLDLNGILCDVVCGSHGSCLPYKKVRLRSVFKRPFLDDFLAFCFERFAVGIWSSRNKNNIIGVINYIMGDSKDRLLFCWDQSKCTFTGFNTIENRHKPLVLKELVKLWRKQEASLPWKEGEYSPSNTLLVDDSPYKAICNPPHTAIFPFSYDFRDEGDSALGPGGAIRAYLESISMADDVQAHVRKHSFGQQAISSHHRMWSFYRNIIDNNNSVALTPSRWSVCPLFIRWEYKNIVAFNCRFMKEPIWFRLVERGGATMGALGACAPTGPTQIKANLV